MIKIPLHSVIDLITNSSTEIFVYSENSLKPAKELINEILKLQGSDKTCDDVFDLKITMDDYQIKNLIEYGELDEDVQLELQKDITKHVVEIQNGEKPEWFVENKWHVETYLEITVKDKKYADLATKLKTFLYSTNHDEHSWG